MWGYAGQATLEDKTCLPCMNLAVHELDSMNKDAVKVQELG